MTEFKTGLPVQHKTTGETGRFRIYVPGSKASAYVDWDKTPAGVAWVHDLIASERTERA